LANDEHRKSRLNVAFWQILLQKSYGHAFDETMESELRVQRIEVALLQPSAIQSCAPRPPKHFCNSICTLRTNSIPHGMSVVGYESDYQRPRLSMTQYYDPTLPRGKVMQRKAQDIVNWHSGSRS